MLNNSKSNIFKIILTFFLLNSCAVYSKSQEDTKTDSIENRIFRPGFKDFSISAAEVVGLNVGVHLFDRFALKADYAQVGLYNIKFNLKNGFVWDNDHFSTNLFWHPYHGSLYFTAARTNGLNFWQSVPYAVSGSLLWEYFGENEQPSINDLITTPIGGMAVGEISYRISNLLLDESTVGFERFARELLAGLASPMNFINRLMRGDVGRRKAAANGASKIPFLLHLSASNRSMTDLDDNRSNFNLLLSSQMVYGEHFINDVRRPYDFFMVNFDCNIAGNQPLISSANIIGLLWGQEYHKNKIDFLAGVFQHFDYYDSSPLKKGARQPFEFAEAASFGGGVMFAKQSKYSNNQYFIGSAYANIVILGASESDYYNVDNRNYNLGSGYSIKLNWMYVFSKRWHSGISINHYHLFTNNHQDSKTAEYDDSQHLSLKGNEGNASLSMISLDVNFIATKHLKISAQQRFYTRSTHYKYFPDIEKNATENRLSLTYMLFNK
ncbi:MAG: DUF3943 domain-containing protein [Prevotellaceae bacterium]|jgi:hypothetical protein|nr:DUF3943 domain-containing protein [Prevotellaceae bacterium]